MTDSQDKNDIGHQKEELEDIDPAIFDDPILLLQWLEGKPPNSDSPSPPAGDITEEKVKAVSVPSRRNKKANNSQSDTVLEIAHLVAIEELSMVGNFPEWLDARVSPDSKREILQACSIVEAYAYQYKLLSCPLLDITNISTIRNIQNLLVQKKEFRCLDATKRYMCGLALRQFVQFLTEIQNPSNELGNTPSLSSTEKITSYPNKKIEPSQEDLMQERNERARKWAESNLKERELLEKERQARAHKWATKHQK